MAILIDNFSINVGDWVEIAGITGYSIEITDFSSTIDTGNTYFLINEIPVVTTFSGITDGYRATCSTTISGSQIVTIHAENTSSGIVEEDFNLLFGYHIEFPEYIDWGPGNEVTIYAEARNETMCSNKEIYATYFETKDLDSVNLSATILPTGWANLQASIEPQSKYFFYGRTYKIKVAGIKDFSGNELEPFEFEFTIEAE